MSNEHALMNERRERMGRPHETGLVYLVVDGLALLIEALYFINLVLALALVLGARASVPSPGLAAYLARQQHVAGKSQS